MKIIDSVNKVSDSEAGEASKLVADSEAVSVSKLATDSVVPVSAVVAIEDGKVVSEIGMASAVVKPVVTEELGGLHGDAATI